VDNPRLHAMVDGALGANMKRDTVDKAIQCGAGGGEGDNYAEQTCQGYGLGGVAILVESMTDNRNRTVAEVRQAFGKARVSLGTDGLDKTGSVLVFCDHDEGQVLNVSLDAGSEGVLVQDNGSVEVVTAPSENLSVKGSLVIRDIKVLQSELYMVPATTVVLDEDGAENNTPFD
jgi:transcriptional/translational regulatory protein YebC/TACO1